MKRFLAVLLVLSLALGTLFAAEGRIGVSVAPQWLWNTNTDADDGEMNISLLADGANYFGKDGGLGIEYGLGIFIPVNTWLGDQTFESSADSAFLFKVGLGYKHAFSDMFGLAAGAGVLGRVQSYEEGGSIGGLTLSGRTTAFIMDLYGSVGVQIDILDFLGINAGVMVGGPVLSTLTTTVSGSWGDLGGDHTETTTLEPYGVWLSPFVGVSFVY